MTTLPRRLWFEFRSRVASSERNRLLFRILKELEIAKNRKQWGEEALREHMIHEDTELVIDGFQGSANSFATEFFKAVQEKPVKLAHHMHSAGEIIRGARRGIPTVVTIREPKGAVLSLCARWPHIPLASALEAYSRFYRKMPEVAERCVISDFATTTKDFSQVIEVTNQRFSTSFSCTSSEGVDPNEMRSLKTSSEEKAQRQANKERLRSQLGGSPQLVRLEESAQKVYEALAESSV